MAVSLKVFHWDGQILDAEAAHVADDIVVEGSDLEDSPSTKAERRRRRETIGQRYLKGYLPFIQSALLHGPFGSGSGCENLWRRRQESELVPEPLKLTRITSESKWTLTPLEEHESVTATSNIQKLAYTENEMRNEHAGDYTGIHGAEIGGNIFRDTYSDGYIKNHDNRIWADRRAEYSYFSADVSQSYYNGSNIVNASLNNLKQSPQRNADKVSNGIVRTSSRDRNKRAANTSWLKGRHIIKRSRYETLENSSPTPVVRIGRAASIQSALCSSPPIRFSTPQMRLDIPRATATDQKDLSSTELIMPSSPARKLSETDHFAANNLEAVRDRSLWQKGQSREIETSYSNTELKDVQGFSQASHLAMLGANLSAAPRTLRDRQLRATQLSSMKSDGKATISLKKPQGSHEEVVLVSKAFNTQNRCDPGVNGVDTMNSPCSLSPASEGSFQYRRRNRKSKLKNEMQELHHIAILEKSLEESMSQIEELGFEYVKDNKISFVKENSPINGKRSVDDEGHKALVAITEQHIGHDGKWQSKRYLHDSEQDTEAVFDEVSSLDLSNEDRIRSCKVQTSSAGNSSLQTFPAARRVYKSYDTAQRSGRMAPKQNRYPPEELKEARQFQLATAIVTEAQQLISRYSRNTLETFNQADYSLNCEVTDAPNEHDLLHAQSTHVRELSYGEKLKENAVTILDKPITVKQSPWMGANGKESQLKFSLSDISENEKPHENKQRHCFIVHKNDKIPDGQSNQVQKTSLLAEITDVEDDPLTYLESPHIKCQRFSETTTEFMEPFPSTQVLVDAATANPWNSAMKKSRLHSSIKRVSFGPLPLYNIDNEFPQSMSKVTEQLKSPPPPEGALRQADLDEDFRYQFRATKNLDVAEESLTKRMNTPSDQIPAMKARAKPLPNSPAVDAMAEAFIAADRDSLFKAPHLSRNSKLIKANVKKMKSLVAPASWSKTTSERQETRTNSTLDASFSIDPRGKVTAVDCDFGAFDIEENLDAMIDEVGSFFKGWDVDSELKKARGHKLGEQGKREQLSDLSNR